jgi:hypothetical protein
MQAIEPRRSVHSQGVCAPLRAGPNLRHGTYSARPSPGYSPEESPGDLHHNPFGFGGGDGKIVFDAVNFKIASVRSKGRALKFENDGKKAHCPFARSCPPRGQNGHCHPIQSHSAEAGTLFHWARPGLSQETGPSLDPRGRRICPLLVPLPRFSPRPHHDGNPRARAERIYGGVQWPFGA